MYLENRGMKLPKSRSQGEQNIHSIMITMRTNANGGDDDRDIASTAWGETSTISKVQISRKE